MSLEAEHMSETGDTVTEEQSITQKTLDLVQGLSKTMAALEAAQLERDTHKRPRQPRNAGFDEEDEAEDDEPREKKPRTFVVSSPTKEFLTSAFCRSKPLENATRHKLMANFDIPEGN